MPLHRHCLIQNVSEGWCLNTAASWPACTCQYIHTIANKSLLLVTSSRKSFWSDPSITREVFDYKPVLPQQIFQAELRIFREAGCRLLLCKPQNLLWPHQQRSLKCLGVVQCISHIPLSLLPQPSQR